MEQLITNLVGQLPGFIIGVASALIIAFGSGFINLFFKGIERRSKHKLNVARHVLEICNEASSHSFKQLPRDPEHVNSVLTNLEGVDKKMSVEMEKLVSSWVSFSGERSRGDLSPDDAKFAKEQLDRAERNRKILVGWANEIRAGKTLTSYLKSLIPD